MPLVVKNVSPVRCRQHGDRCAAAVHSAPQEEATGVPTTQILFTHDRLTPSVILVVHPQIESIRSFWTAHFIVGK
jgi:hypothetical protein